MVELAKNNRRIAKNTFILYIRMLFTMFVSLYTSRVVLNVLGVEDFGIYNVVGGLVLMLSIVSGAISVAISRFITFGLGENNQPKLNKVFTSAVIVQMFICLVVVIASETLGLWFLNSHLNFPSERLYAVNVVYQFSILTFCANLINIPFNSAIIAHERMGAFAYISIYDSIAKLVVAFLIPYAFCDKLEFYGFALFCVMLSVYVITFIYCRTHFNECRIFSMSFDREILKEILSYAGWTYIGTSSALLRDAGGNLLINIFYGPIANAARSIGVQVQYGVNLFVLNFMTALNPQITKNFATGNYEYVNFLVFYGAKISYFMILFLSLPILLDTRYVLMLWLNQTPEFSIAFVRLALLFVMSESISNTLITAACSSGKIRNYQLIVGGIQSLNFPFSLLFLYIGFPPYSIFVVAIVISQVCLFARLFVLKKMIEINILSFMKEVYLRILLVSIIAVAIPFTVKDYCSNSIIGIVALIIVCFISVSVTVYYLGCNARDRVFLREKLAKFYKTKILRRDDSASKNV